jgi:hypothetical protein
MEDVWKQRGNSQSLTCTANDVRIASAENIRDLKGNPLGQCSNGRVFSFIADFRAADRPGPDPLRHRAPLRHRR